MDGTLGRGCKVIYMCNGIAEIFFTTHYHLHKTYLTYVIDLLTPNPFLSIHTFFFFLKSFRNTLYLAAGRLLKAAGY